MFSHTVVIGDKRKYLTVLLCLKLKNPELLADDVVEYITARGSNAKTIKEAIACPTVKKIISEGLEKANEKAISNAQKVQKFTIIPFEFTVDSGLLTPTMKLKRKIINQRFEA